MKRFKKPILVTRPYLPPIGFYYVDHHSTNRTKRKEVMDEQFFQ